jgi:multidrug efflux pump subunit AcrA (membrane-fusion protein)
MFSKLKNLFTRVWTYILSHKIKGIIVVILLLVAVYYGNSFLSKSDEETRYILTSVNQGMITTTVSGSGQVAPKEEKTIKTKSSGEVTYLNPAITEGATISKGTLIATIDTADAKKSIQEAEESLESAQISLTKLIGANESNPRNKQEAEDDLSKEYEDSYNTISSAFLDLPSITKDLNEILYEKTFNTYQDNLNYYTYSAYTYDESVMTYKKNIEDSYKIAREKYKTSFENYKKTDVYSEDETIDGLITETYETSKSVSQAIKDAINIIQFYEDTMTYYGLGVNSMASTHLSTLSSDLSKINSDISSLFNATSNIKDKKQALEDVDSDIRTAKLSVTQKERSLEEAKDSLNDCYIYATMGGLISEVNIKQNEDASSGSTAVTIITDSKIAEITLSEVDVANIKVGNKVILTFDAIEDLTISGEVAMIDSVGSTSSGVVSYGIEIVFDTNEESIKAGMSVNATILTNSKNDVLTVSTSAIKSNNDGTYYVQVLGNTYDLTDKTNSAKGVISPIIPTTKIVEIGLSDDINTEIISGLSEGDQVVLRTSSTTSSSSSSSGTEKSSSILNVGGAGGGRPPGM